MIEIKDIETAVSDILKKNGHTVTASEVEQGFVKPTFFIEVLPVSVELQNQYYEIVTDSVELTYHPLMETREQLIEMSETIKNIFLYQPILIKDRYLSINGITFDTDKSALVTYFEYEFLQETNVKIEELPKMKTLQESVVTESHGTSSGTD